MHRLLVALFFGILTTAPLAAQEETRDFNAEVNEALAEIDWPGMIRLPIGVTPRGTVIWALMDKEALDYRSKKDKWLSVGGLSGDKGELDELLQEVRKTAELENREFLIALVPLANPDGWASQAAAGDSADQQPQWTFPPTGPAYNSGTTTEAAYVWRFAGWYAPDTLCEIVPASDPVWGEVRKNGGSRDDWPRDSLAAAADREPVAGIAKVFSTRLPPQIPDEPLEAHWNVLRYSGALENPPVERRHMGDPPWSELRKEMIHRLDRAPNQVATELTAHYGDHLKTVMYQPALALIARLRFGELTGDKSHLEEIEQLVAPYATGDKPALPENVSGSRIAGHLVFAELARITGKQEYADLVLEAASFGFDENGRPKKSMPFHSEMSDAVFMGCPILTAAGRLTGEMKYFEMALRHLEFMRALCVREDGLYRHSPLCEAAWGRGNGFPMLGVALVLSDVDATLSDPGAHGLTVAETIRLSRMRAELYVAYHMHLAALLKHQDPTGTWHQVIDFPASYRELSCTCMITFAMLRGLRNGWLDEETYLPIVEKAWEGIKVRVGDDGTLFDVCTGTGKQQTRRDYLDREAILGRDERGGAMALLVSVEMAEWMASR